MLVDMWRRKTYKDTDTEGNMQTRLKQIRGKKQSYIEVSKEMWIKALLSARPGN